MGNDRQPGRQRRDAAFVLAVKDDVGDHRMRRDLGDLGEHGLLGVDWILVVDQDHAGAADHESDVGSVPSHSPLRKVEIVLQLRDDKRLYEPECVDDRL